MAFEFFRRHQRFLIYTAGIFTLLTFSITGSVLGFSDWLFGDGYDGPTMKLADGREVSLQQEDVEIGRRLARGMYGTAVVLPDFNPGEDANLDDVLAALRRLAIESGIGVSDAEVNRAIDQAAKVASLMGEEITPTQLALRAGSDSLPAYQNVVREAMRVGTFLRLQVLAADVSDAALAESILEDEERVTFDVAVLEKEAIEEELKKTPPSDDDLRKWVEEQVADNPVHQYRESSNRVALRAVGLRYADFDAAPYAEGALAGVTFDDATLQREYDLRKATYFPNPAAKKDEVPPDEGPKNGDGKGGDGGSGARQDPDVPPPPVGGKGEAAAPGAGEAASDQAPGDQAEGQTTPTTVEPPQDPYRPFDEVKEDLRKMLQAEAVLATLTGGDMQLALAQHVSEQVTARNAAAAKLQAANAALAKVEAELAEIDAESEEGIAKTKAVEEAKALVETEEAAKKAAEEALEQRRVAFDFVGEAKKALGSHAFVVDLTVAPPKTGEELRDLGDLGTWETHWLATGMTEAGKLSTQVQKTDKVAFHFQLTEVVDRPVKAFDEIKEQVLEDYYKSKADEQAKEKAEAFEKAMLEAAKAKVQEKISELEQQRVADVEKKFTEWKTKIEEEIAKDQEILANNADQPRIARLYNERLEELRAELAAADDKRKEFEKEVGEAVDTDIEKAAKKAFPEVLAEVAPNNGFEVRTVGPLSRNLSRSPRFRDRFDGATRYLFGDAALDPNLAEIEAGDVTGMLDDATGRATYLAVCKAVEPGDISQLTRRQIESQRDSFLQQRMQSALNQSFTLEALKKRYKYKVAPDDQETEARPTEDG